MRVRSRIDYLESLYAEATAKVPLASGDSITLRRLGLGPHFRLQELGKKIGQVTLEERVGALRVWLHAAGIPRPDGLSLSDLPGLVRAIKALNAPRGRLAWDEIALPEPDPGVKPVDYPGRALARIVDLLARSYGWDLERILNLSPEVALAHAQECVLADRRRREWEYGLSEIAWEYDAGSRTSHYRPLPPLPWETLPTERKHRPVPDWIKERYYPKGVIEDLTEGSVRTPGPGE